MVDDALKAQINMKVDGMLSAAEAGELDDRLAADPEARAYYDGLIKVSTMLSSIPQQAPPPELRANILNSLPTKKYEQVQREPVVPGLLRKLRASLTYRPAYVFAAGLAFGLFAATLLGDVFQTHNLKSPALSGSMTTAGKPLHRLEIEHEQVHGTIAVARRNGLLWLGFELTSLQPLTLELEFGSPVRLASAIHQSGGFGQSITLSGAELQMALRGENRFELSFATGEDGFSSLRIALSGKTVSYERSLDLNILE